MTFYYHTTIEAARRILSEGFKDDAGCRAGGRERAGVWLSACPPGLMEGAAGDCLLRLTTDLAEADMADFEAAEESKAYREWLVPAALINSRMRAEVVDESPVDRGGS